MDTQDSHAVKAFWPAVQNTADWLMELGEFCEDEGAAALGRALWLSHRWSKSHAESMAVSQGYVDAIERHRNTLKYDHGITHLQSASCNETVIDTLVEQVTACAADMVPPTYKLLSQIRLIGEETHDTLLERQMIMAADAGESEEWTVLHG